MANVDEVDSKQGTPIWLYITIAILLVPLSVTIYLSLSDNDVDVSAPLDTACDLQRGPCQSVFPDGAKVTLSIQPLPIRALSHLHIQVQVEGIRAHTVMLDFRGVNMNMGYNRPQLTQVAAGKFEGTWVLASCGLERMVWEATVIIETARLKMAAPFPLVTSTR